VYSYDDIYAFLVQEAGAKRERLTPDTSLFNDLGVDGDDFFELAATFARSFKVDMSGYLWYFHHGAEGLDIGAALFPPYGRITLIPVTAKLLLESANAGKWLLEYPPHKLSRRRYDQLANLVIFAAIILLGLYSVFIKLKG